MTQSGFNKQERDELVQAYLQIRRRASWPESQNLSVEEGRELYRQERELLLEYAESLPLEPVSRCPFCSTVLEYPLDPYGLDGPWWMSRPIVQYPDAVSCSHFRILAGAVDFRGRVPLEARPWSRVVPGPGVPYVIPGVLDYKGTLAVLSTYSFPSGDLAYLMAYFIEVPTGGRIRYQPWPRDNYVVINDEGGYEGWGFSTDAWDFDLQHYVDKGQLYWISPHDEALVLTNNGSCPFIGREGSRQPQVIEYGELQFARLPSGESASPVD